ncbi:archaeal/vacuolar-type H+-ATPase subunit E [Sphaerochaeta pleomorpha str. Grapes]|uniref:V-type ATP synthase subunit E n=1 Tax=Sphaerochaeta pleomorpha (strain ATCC BAA-1885 / DSM 22778 / Grapes) TaxID=158190 RepID=G8QYL2_SPHPG|nr:V-type ATP synthase subunit E family protein [Sphaerochaeta pleomorpha]AEV28575.1 archaeal/vacuolar-type H+-ATPase subunit E [Sphaerochaeta pleomorpha str. Grapes]
MEKSDNLLLNGIITEAQNQAEKIKADASRQCEQILVDAQKRADHEIELENHLHEQRMKQVDLRLQANLGSAKRRASLKKIDASYQEVMRRVNLRMNSFARSKEFVPFLAEWIAEAAIGLDLKEAKVAFNPLCPVTEETLTQATELVKNITGSDIHLSLDSKPIRSLGVVLSSLDDKVSYNNQVDIRLRRFDREIRTLVQEYTWKAE